MAKNAKETQKLLRKCRLRAEFLGVGGTHQMSRNNLIRAIQKVTGTRNFMQHLFYTKKTDLWVDFVEKKGMSEKRSKRVFKDKSLSNRKRSASKHNYNPLDE